MALSLATLVPLAKTLIFERIVGENVTPRARACRLDAAAHQALTRDEFAGFVTMESRDDSSVPSIAWIV